MSEHITETLQRLAPGVVPIPHEAGRFEVQSKSRSGWKYTVDISEYGVNSSCTCDGFQRFGKRSALDRGTTCGNSTECEHIKRVNRYLALVCKNNFTILIERGKRNFVEMMMSPLPDVVEPVF